MCVYVCLYVCMYRMSVDSSAVISMHPVIIMSSPMCESLQTLYLGQTLDMAFVVWLPSWVMSAYMDFMTSSILSPMYGLLQTLSRSSIRLGQTLAGSCRPSCQPTTVQWCHGIQHWCGVYVLQWTPSNLDPWNEATPVVRPLLKYAFLVQIHPWNEATPLISDWSQGWPD